MKFGIREVCDMQLTKRSGVGPASFTIDTAKTSTLEGTSTTVYAQGGRGNSRLMAWEGEKTLTFTVEDALITMDSFWALTGAHQSRSGDSLTFKVYPTTFAGYYSITANTLFRDEDGYDHPAILTIPNAKLQSNINLTMAPSGDPSTFTFTFDAFPDPDQSDMLFSLEIEDKEANQVNVSEGTNFVLNKEVCVNISGLASQTITLTGSNISTTLTVELETITGTPATYKPRVKLNGTVVTMPDTWKANAILTDLVDYVNYNTYTFADATTKTFTLTEGTHNFYIID